MMNSRQLFKNRGIVKSTPKPNTRNEAGGQAFSLSDKAALAQFAVTGTFTNTFYTDASTQLKQVEKLCANVDSPFLAKLAVYSRQNGKMKDMPAYFLAVLAARGETELLKTVFYQVCDNSKMLFNFIRIIRSGAVGRKSFGTAIKRMIQNWIADRSDKGLFLSSIGHSDPSMADTIRMVHPRPVDESQGNMFSYLLGFPYNHDALPAEVQDFEMLKAGNTAVIPDVPFRALTNCNLGIEQWTEIGLNMPWNTLRQNLNMLERRGVFNSGPVIKKFAAKLSDKVAVKRSGVFPYQVLCSYLATKNSMPIEISNALQEAMECAVENVPIINGDTVIAVDVSGSMGSAIGTSSVVRCVDVAALIAVAFMRSNKSTLILPFDDNNSYRSMYGGRSSTKVDGIHKSNLDPFNSIMTNAQELARYGGGGTDCSLPFKYLNKNGIDANNVILISDNQSWSGHGGNNGVAVEWTKYVAKNKSARLMNIDIQPYITTQIPDNTGKVVNVAGWSDEVFSYMDYFFNGKMNGDFVSIIENF